jgi:hypothetical protein
LIPVLLGILCRKGAKFSAETKITTIDVILLFINRFKDQVAHFKQDFLNALNISKTDLSKLVRDSSREAILIVNELPAVNTYAFVGN